MRFYEWRHVGKWRNQWENHVFPAGFGSPNQFTALCGEQYGALNGENKKTYHCNTCAKLAPIHEKKAQTKERARVKRQELRRPDITNKINDILKIKSMDELLYILRNLKR